jgi:serine/threonine protein kinase
MKSNSVEELCRLLRRSRLLTPEEILTLVQRWRSETGEPGDAPASLDRFSRWLVEGRFLTEYQVTTLRNGHADHFFLAGFKLLDRIGKGRQMRVYKAIDRVGQLAALKVLPPSRARFPQALARFHREARVGGRLDHANVLRLLGGGEEDGLHYMVMEYVEGETLQQAIASRGRLTPAEAASLAEQALSGLVYLHQQGIVHRDIEPSNLMLVHPTGVKLLGLGLSQAEGEDDPLPEVIDYSRPAPEGVALPLPGYLAPEMARDPHTVDGRADLYAMGCVLYHALAGQPPFTDFSAVQLTRRHATDSPRPLRALNPDVPEELAQFISCMMARDVADRYSGPAEAVEAVRAIQAARAESVATVQVEALQWPAWLTPGTAAPTPAPVTRVASTPPPPPPPPRPVVAEERVSAFEIESPNEVVKPASVIEPPRFRGREPLLDRRDWLLLLVGAGSLLVVQVLGWLVGRLARLWR